MRGSEKAGARRRRGRMIDVGPAGERSPTRDLCPFHLGFLGEFKQECERTLSEYHEGEVEMIVDKPDYWWCFFLKTRKECTRRCEYTMAGDEAESKDRVTEGLDHHFSTL